MYVEKNQSVSEKVFSLGHKFNISLKLIPLFLIISLLLLTLSFAEEKTNYGFSMTSAPYDKHELLNSGYKVSGNFNVKYNLSSRFFILGMAGLAYQQLNYDPGTETYFFWEYNQYNTINYTNFDFTNLEIPIAASLNYNFLDKKNFKLFASLGLSYNFIVRQGKDINFDWEYNVVEPIHGGGIWDDYYDFGEKRHFYALDLGLGMILPINDHDIIIQYQRSGEDRAFCRANKITLGFYFKN